MQTVSASFRRFTAGFGLVFLFLACAASAAADGIATPFFPEDGIDPNAPAAPAPKPLARFTLTEVETLARGLSAAPYDNAANAVPDYLLGLGRDEWLALRLKPEQVLWKDEGLPFAIGFFHPGYVFNRFAEINIVDERGVMKIPFSADMFEIGDEALAARIRSGPAGFAGFQVLVPSESAEEPYGTNSGNRLAGFMGASNFLFKGRNSRLGAFSRPVAFDTALPSGEVFPYFRELWLIKPRPGDDSLTVYALMDSPALTGAYSLRITPGTSAVVRVEARLFKRPNAQPPAKVGLAPLAGMFLYSETDNGRPGDYRPEMHNVDGLLFGDDKTWSWRPLANNPRLNISGFPLANPRGFGLMQRDAVFDHYQDIAARFDRSASVWVEPGGDWGPGRLELIEIPGSREFHQNILSLWVPDAVLPPPAAGDGGPDRPGPRDAAPFLTYSYTMYWMPPGASPHALGKATDTRMVRNQDAGEVTFLVDFEGGELGDLDPAIGLTSVVEAPAQTTLLEKTLVKNPATSGWRLTMRFRLPENGMLDRLLAARDGPAGIRFTAQLKKGENIPDPLTETWVYDLVP